ncbi:MAG: LamG domain-containing protein, partial [Bacteroidia bacterium]|nr:LamG domain-containing protein [Bacteroidia bacterium]
VSGNTERFRGYIDQVRIWNVPRSQSQIRDHMYSVLAPQNGLLVYYHFDDYVSGNTITNAAGSNFNGTRTGAAAIVNNTLCVNYERPVFTASNTGPGCVGGTVQLSVSPPLPDATYTWTGPSGFSASGPSVGLSPFLASQVGTYRVVVERQCCRDTLFTQVYTRCAQVPSQRGFIPSFQIEAVYCGAEGSLPPYPNVGVAAVPPSISVGQSSTLVATGAQSYIWQPGGATGPSITVSPTVTTTYTVTGIAEGGCAFSRTVTVFVDCPRFTVSASRQNVCPGQTSALSVSNPGAYKIFTWEPAESLSVPYGSTVFASPGETTVYTVTAYREDGCSYSTTFALIVGDGVSGLNVSQNEVCEGGTVTVSASGNQLQWFVNGIPIAAPQGNVLNETLFATTSFRVRGVDNIGCAVDVSRTVRVVPAGYFSVSRPSASCANAPVTLSILDPVEGLN